MSDKKRVNGSIYDWGSIVCTVDGERFYGFTTLDDPEETLEVAKVWGMSKNRAPRGRTNGKYTPGPGKIGGPLGSITDFLALLGSKAADGKSFGKVVFQVVVQFIEADETPYKIEWRDCRVTKRSGAREEGADGLMSELELDVMSVSHYVDGKELTMFDSSEG